MDGTKYESYIPMNYNMIDNKTIKIIISLKEPNINDISNWMYSYIN